jgi:hypothetical protein
MGPRYPPPPPPGMIPRYPPPPGMVPRYPSPGTTTEDPHGSMMTPIPTTFF